MKTLFFLVLMFCGLLRAENLSVLCLVSEDTASQGLTDLDPRAVEAYRKQGFDLHFGFYQKTTRDDLLRHSVVVGMIPQLHAGTEPISPLLAADLDFFMKSGGGLVMIPGPSYYGVDDFVRRLNPFLKPYGIGISNDIPMDSNPANTLTQVRALAYRYLKTSALNPSHPVTKGIPFVYLPLDFSYSYVRTYTMTPPSPEWEILITGETTCASYTRESMATGRPEKGLWDSKVPFLAVRKVGNGSLALFTTASRYFIYDAFHWAFGEGFVLNEGNGLNLMCRLFRYVSRNHAALPVPRVKPTERKEDRVMQGNLPVIQDRFAWYDSVLKTWMPKGFGVRFYINCGGISDGSCHAKRNGGLLTDPSGSWAVRRTWMDIFHPTGASGRAADRKSFRYRFDSLDAGKQYRIGLLLWSTQKEGARDLVASWQDQQGNIRELAEFRLPRYDQENGPRFEVAALPAEAVRPDGTLILDFRCGSGGEGSFTLLSELWLFEEGAKKITPQALAAEFCNPAFGLALQPESRQWHYGLVGARSPLRGKGESPQALAAAAGKRGLDFLVYTDDLSDTSPDSFARLSEICSRLSTKHFRMIPGIALAAAESGAPRYDRPQRNRTIRAWFAGPIRRLPAAEELKNPHTLFWKFFGGENSTGIRTPANLITPCGNALSPYFQRFWRGLDIADPDSGKSGNEQALELYRSLTADGYGPQPRCRGVYRTAEEVRSGLWLLAIPAPPGEEPWPSLYAACTTSGPRFLDVSFSSDLARSGEVGNGDIFRKELWTVASLHVVYDQEISDAVLYSGNRIVRHFRPGKKEVAITEPVRIDRQTSLFWIVKAADGATAVTGSYSFTDERMRGSMCADNQNSICSVGKAPSKFLRDERELYLQHSYWHTGEAQGQLGVMCDARQLVPRVIETGIIQLCKYLQPMPLIRFSNGRTEDHRNSRMRIRGASGEGNCINYTFQIPDGVFRSSVLLTSFRPAADGDTSVLAELTLCAERDLDAAEIASLRILSLGLMPSFPPAWHYRAETSPGHFHTGKLSGRKDRLVLSLAPRGIAALGPGTLAAPLVVSLNSVPLEVVFDECSAWNCRERLSIQLPARKWKKGEPVHFSFLIQLSRRPLNTDAALLMRKQEILQRGACVEKMWCGTRKHSFFILDLLAENYTAAWQHGGWSGNDPLPVRIHGLNPNWSAVATAGKEIAPLPVHEDGTGLFALPEGPACRAVFGHPVLADDPLLQIEYAGLSERGISFHLHNPHAGPRTFRLRSNPMFEPLVPRFAFRLTLNEGAGMWITANQNTFTIDSIK